MKFCHQAVVHTVDDSIELSAVVARKVAKRHTTIRPLRTYGYKCCCWYVVSCYFGLRTLELSTSVQHGATVRVVILTSHVLNRGSNWSTAHWPLLATNINGLSNICKSSFKDCWRISARSFNLYNYNSLGALETLISS
eukprot:2720456-Pleurochrysis_carterae.AAC.3